MKTNIVGFHGPAGSGKDTCGLYLIERHGFVKMSFATPLKVMLGVLGYPEPKTLEEKQRMTDLGVTWRHMAQTLGTEWGRKLINPQIWLIIAQRHIEQHPDVRFVFTDVRFENEAQLIRDMGGVMVHIRGRRGDVDAATAGHPSEKALLLRENDHLFFNDLDGIAALEAGLAQLLGDRL